MTHVIHLSLIVLGLCFKYSMVFGNGGRFGKNNHHEIEFHSLNRVPRGGYYTGRQENFGNFDNLGTQNRLPNDPFQDRMSSKNVWNDFGLHSQNNIPRSDNEDRSTGWRPVSERKNRQTGKVNYGSGNSNYRASETGEAETTPEPPIDESEFRLPEIAGIAEVRLCSASTDEGMKECLKTCKDGVVNCLSHGCFCSTEYSKTQQTPGLSRSVKINHFTGEMNELLKRSPLHACGENTYEGSQSCRNTCGEKADMFVCVTDLCYCNLKQSTERILEPLSEDVAATKPQRTFDVKYDPSQIISSWQCAIGTDPNTKVGAHEKCIRECSGMKANDPKDGVMLTCDARKGKCKCITFPNLTAQQVGMELETQGEARKRLSTTRKPVIPCRGYACLIQAQIEKKKPDESYAQRPIDNFAFCGPNSELGFTKCRDVCTYEKRGVVRCAGHSCYCHFGGVPFFDRFGTGGGGSESRAIGSRPSSKPCSGKDCIEQIDNANDVPSGYKVCGFPNEEGYAKCALECKHMMGTIKCGEHFCYCLYRRASANEVLHRSNFEGFQSIPAPFRSRFVFCGKEESNCKSLCEFIGDVICGRLGCYCDSGL